MRIRNYIFQGLILVFSIVVVAQMQPTAARALPLQANLAVSGSVSDVNGGSLLANDVLEFTEQLSNVGDENATLIVLTDNIPTGTTYVAGSMKINGVAKSDGLLDDQADYNGIAKEVTFRLGTGATSLLGGILLPGASTTVKFRVKISALATSGTSISNQASTTYSGLLIIDTHTALSDADANAPGSQPNIVFVNTPPPSIQLVHSVSPGGSQPSGTDLVFTTTFTNTGGAQGQNFAITDSIPNNTQFKIGSVATNLGTTGLTALIQYSNNSGATFLYTPVSGGGGGPSGYDRNVTTVRIVFAGMLSMTSPNNTGSVSFASQIR